MKSLMWFLTFIASLMLTMDVCAAEPNLPKGKRLYRSYCLVCHGVDGKGAELLAKKLDIKPADLSSEQYRTKQTGELAAIIGNYGKKSGLNIPDWGDALPKSDLRNVAAYISNIGLVDHSYTGDTRRGRTIFKGACIACHGEFGAGNGVLAKLIDIAMIDQTDGNRMKDISDEALIDTIRDGKGRYMASWKGALNENEIHDVVAYVRLLPALANDKHVEYVPNPLVGRRLYRSYCLVCHGVNGRTIGPVAHKLKLEPSDLSTEKYQSKTVEVLAAIIEGYGRKPESNMPAWGLELLNKELRDIAAYLKMLTVKDLRYQGNARRGRSIFKASCISCHGKFGTGKGILAPLFKTPMLDLTDSKKMDQISDEEILNAIRKGKGDFMAPWKETLNPKEVIDAAAFIRSLSR